MDPVSRGFWLIPETIKSDRYKVPLLILPLSNFTRAPEARRTRPEEPLCSVNNWSPGRGRSLFVFNSAIMIVYNNVPIL